MSEKAPRQATSLPKVSSKNRAQRTFLVPGHGFPQLIENSEAEFLDLFGQPYIFFLNLDGQPAILFVSVKSVCLQKIAPTCRLMLHKETRVAKRCRFMEHQCSSLLRKVSPFFRFRFRFLIRQLGCCGFKSGD